MALIQPWFKVPNWASCLPKPILFLKSELSTSDTRYISFKVCLAHFLFSLHFGVISFKIVIIYYKSSNLYLHPLKIWSRYHACIEADMGLLIWYFKSIIIIIITFKICRNFYKIKNSKIIWKKYIKFLQNLLQDFKLYENLKNYENILKIIKISKLLYKIFVNILKTVENIIKF